MEEQATDKNENGGQEEKHPEEPFQPHHMREFSGEQDDVRDLRERIVEALRTIYDPEIPVNIYEIGLIYEIDVKEDHAVDVKMTLTSPNCPVAGSLPPETEAKVRSVEGVKDCRLELVWEPPWGMSMMSEAAQLQLGL